MADYNSSYTGAEIDEGVGNGLAAPTTYAPIDHAASASTYGAGTGTKYGHLMLSDSTSSTFSISDGVAATPAAVKAAKDAIPSAYTSTPAMNGTGAAGSSSSWARGDHVHPVDTSRAAATDLTSLSGSLATYVRPNILDNAYFVGGGSQQGGGKFPINQRGKTSYSTAAYSIDRWTCGQAVAVTVSPSFSFSLPAVGNGLFQYVDFPERLLGQKVTISALSGTTLSKATFTMPDSIPASGTVGDGTAPSLIGSGNVNCYLRVLNSKLAFVFYAGSNYPVDTAIPVTAAKLEIGDTQTLAHQENGTWVLNEAPNYQQELARCQRFFVACNPFRAGYCKPGIGYLRSSTKGMVFISHPTMRSAPSVSYTGNWSLEKYDQTKYSVTAMDADTVSASGSMLNITISGGTSGALVALMANNDTTADIYLSADL